MKKLFLILLLATVFQSASQAQVDLQINPVSILFGALQLSTEFSINNNAGAGFDIIAAEGGFGIVAVGKYYMDPNYGTDRFFIGLFAGALSDTGAGGGFLGGYKWLAAKGINFELSLGIGRGTGDLDIFPYGKLAVGYRFGNKG